MSNIFFHRKSLMLSSNTQIKKYFLENLYSSLKLVYEQNICISCTHNIPCQDHDSQLVCSFYKDDKFLSVGEQGILSICSMNNNQDVSIKKIQLHNNAVFDFKMFEFHDYLLSASGDQTIGLYDLNKQSKVGNFKYHSASVKSIDIEPHNSNVFMSGCRDGTICYWDIRSISKRPVIVLKNAHISDRCGKSIKQLTKPGITGICSIEKNKFITCASSDDFIFVWDARYMQKTCVSLASINQISDPVCYLTRKWPIERSNNNIQVIDCLKSRYMSGYVDIKIDNGRLFALSTDGNVYSFELSDLNVNKNVQQIPVIQSSYQFNRSFSSSFWSKIDAFDNFLLTANNNVLNLWSFSNTNQLFEFEIKHNFNTICKGINGVSFCPNKYGLVGFCCDCGYIGFCESNSILLVSSKSMVCKIAYNRKNLCHYINNKIHSKNTLDDVSNIPINKRLKKN